MEQKKNYSLCGIPSTVYLFVYDTLSQNKTLPQKDWQNEVY